MSSISVLIFETGMSASSYTDLPINEENYYNQEEDINSDRKEIFESCHELSEEILNLTFEKIDLLGISENTSNNKSAENVLPKPLSKTKLLLLENVAKSNVEPEEQLSYFTPEAISLMSAVRESNYSIDTAEVSNTESEIYRSDLNSSAVISKELDTELLENKSAISNFTHSSFSISPRQVFSNTSSPSLLVEKDATHRNISETLNIPIHQNYNSREELNTSEDIATIDANVKANETIQSNRDTNSLITLFADSMYSNDEEYFHDYLGEDELYASHSSTYPYKFGDPQYLEKSSNASMIAVLDFDLYGCNDIPDNSSQVAGSSKD